MKNELSLETSQKLADQIDALMEQSKLEATDLAVGETVAEAYMYYDDKELPTAREAIRRMLDMKCDILHATITPISYETTDLNDQRIVVDDKVADKWRGCKVLLGQARISSVYRVRQVTLAGAEFLASLDPEELRQLRRVTRKVGKQYGYKMLTDSQCDEIIAESGPETINKILARVV